MRTQKWSEIKARNFTPEQIADIRRRADAEILEMNLRELREHTGKTQEEIAALADMGQSELSRFERRDDHLLSTLRKYVEALGGELEVAAVFGKEKIILHGV